MFSQGTSFLEATPLDNSIVLATLVECSEVKLQYVYIVHARPSFDM